MIRCPKCNKSKHYLCDEGKCQCLCRTHYDNIKNKDDDTKYSTASNVEFNEIMTQAKKVFEKKRVRTFTTSNVPEKNASVKYYNH